MYRVLAEAPDCPVNIRKSIGVCTKLSTRLIFIAFDKISLACVCDLTANNLLGADRTPHNVLGLSLILGIFTFSGNGQSYIQLVALDCARLMHDEVQRSTFDVITCLTCLNFLFNFNLKLHPDK